MGLLYKLLPVLLVFFLLWKLYSMNQNPPFPTMEENPWWGPEKGGKDDTAIKPFRINIPKEDIDDLKKRLSLPLRLTPPLQNANFTYGFNSEVLKTILDYWRTKYDWKQREQRLNSFPQFKTQIEGLDIHFMHVKPNIPSKSKNLKVRPMLLVHGWPGSVVEFDELLPLLTSPQDGSDVVFEVICPSIPGYAFSQASSKQGLGPLATAQIFFKLMKRLGFEQFYTQGGDWGSLIVSHLATLYPRNVLGMHSNMMFVNTPGTGFKQILGSFLPSGFIMTREDEKYMYPLSSLYSYLLRESGYFHIQATKPDTVGAALSNSPVGLAAYILEKFSSWTHKENPFKPDGGLLSKDFPISLDRLLDNLSIYWFSKSITSSMRYYSEGFMMVDLNLITTDVPAGFSEFEQEVAHQPISFATHKFTRILFHRRHEVGGHFAAMERPDLLAKDFHDFVKEVESIEVLEGKREL